MQYLNLFISQAINMDFVLHTELEERRLTAKTTTYKPTLKKDGKEQLSAKVNILIGPNSK